MRYVVVLAFVSALVPSASASDVFDVGPQRLASHISGDLVHHSGSRLWVGPNPASFNRADNAFGSGSESWIHPASNAVDAVDAREAQPLGEPWIADDPPDDIDVASELCELAHKNTGFIDFNTY